MRENDLKILDEMVQIVLIEDECGNITYANDVFCKCFGVKKEDTIGMSIFDFIIPEDRETCNVENMVTPEEPDYIIEGRSKRYDGKIIWIQYVGRAYFDSSGNRTGFQEIGVDITKWKEAIEDSTKELIKANEKLVEVRQGVDYKRTKFKKKLHNGTFIASHFFNDIYTTNTKMKVLIAYAKAVAKGDATILIEGESGTGKELFAQAIHNTSKRVNGPFVDVNCGVIPSELIGSEFFGYVEGAFTGATKGGKAGKFELASGGTLFLDEIGEMPLAQQVALLRVMETRSVTRIGDDKAIQVDVRIVCATNKNLLSEVEKGNFRADLYYRLNVINLKIPPLRERREDILLLIGAYIKRLGDLKIDKERVFSDQNLIWFYTYDWPGNVRELFNMVERLLYLPDSDPTILFNDAIIDEKNTVATQRKREVVVADDSDERQAIVNYLGMYEGNISMVARKMKMARNTLYRKIEKYGITYKRRL